MWMLNQQIFSGDEERGESFLDEDINGICTLSPLQRIYGFAGSLLAGLACMILSLVVFASPIKFAILFTLGNVLAVGSTAFLVGPAQQLQKMFDPVRLYATVVYLGCVVLALICALWIQSKILTILAIICEVCALIWYSLSYIPFARRVVSGMMIRLCDTEI
ncbi:hypothetical protein Nepgr_021534 [Nepenthes gracilis]|uniref:Vesicle transport protein n=1 Tax=Nepenthes gracilis TaxID=150966 RepID=A0AAD3XW57_NEPGR|nr:hypothetical protein Nepgr_021534 [Nepenthes gracilis]